MSHGGKIQRVIDITTPAVRPNATVPVTPQGFARLRPFSLFTPSLFCALLALPGCALFSDAPHYRGIAITAHDLGELTPGISSQADAQALLGPPTVQEEFSPNDWVYIAQVTKMRIASTEGLSSQHVVVLHFDNAGILQKVTQDTKKDAVLVAMDENQTPVPGGKAGFFQQLIGGVGSYNPLGSVAPGAGGGSAGAGGLGGGAGDIGGGSGGGGF
jgi:outer membrane protein assembly factor BamE (lipoprotein component of BamABCDE complex)